MSEGNQEQILFKGSSSPVINLGTFVLGTLIAAAGVVAAFMLDAPLRFAFIGVAALAIAYMFFRWLLIKSRVYEVTTERIRITVGILTRRTDELELYRVKDTTLVEPLTLRLLGLGHLEIQTHDATTPLLRMEAIKGARNLREELRKSVEICRDKKRVRLAEFE
jgi:uncharacterized membrane protein YdbT with pleckstrin-like domain